MRRGEGEGAHRGWIIKPVAVVGDRAYTNQETQGNGVDTCHRVILPEGITWNIYKPTLPICQLCVNDHS